MSFVVPGITHCEKHMNPIGLGHVCEECEKEKKNMTNREWLLNKMQNMSDEEFGCFNIKQFICQKYDVSVCNVNNECSRCRANWLNAEHKEKITLLEAERVILENIDKEYKWIARDKDGKLFIYQIKPKKTKDSWINGKYVLFEAFEHLFQFITWNDEQPYSIEELLKGE